ncbi:MAG: GDYXXLXY domain-containing protein [Pseudomonadota bacterium]
MSRRKRCWQSLVDAGLMAEPPETPLTPPWYVRALQGFGAWVASLFVVLGLLLMFNGVEEAGLAVIGVLSLIGAFALLRSEGGDFLYQASIALSLSGQLCISLAAGQASDTLAAALIAGGVAVALIFLLNDFAHRLIATLVLTGAVFVAAVDLNLERLAVPVLAVPFAGLWATEARWGARRGLFEPVALGLGFGLLAGALFALRLGTHGLPESVVAQVIRVIVVLAALGYVLLGVLEDSRLEGSRRWPTWAVAMVAALAVELGVANAATALLVFVAAMRGQREFLTVAAMLALLVLISHRYYTLELSLLAKSLWLIGAGVVLLALYGVARRLWRTASGEAAPSTWSPGIAIGPIASVIVCLGLAGFGVFRNEGVISRGDVMVLELAPVDPRSLMQGDYMRLNFAVQRTVRQQLRGAPAQRGWVVLRTDDDGVARFVRLASSKPVPAPGSFALRYGWDGRRVNMLTDAFFFEEGMAEVFDAARFGAFRVDARGNVILVQMLDESQQALGAQY